MRVLLIILLASFSGKANAQLKPFYSTEYNKYGYINLQDSVILKPKYDYAWNFSEGMSPMKLNGKYGYVNENGRVIVPPVYNYAGMFSDGLSVVRKGDKYGFIDQSGRLVVPAIYDRADNFHGDRANVCLRRKWRVMIYHGKN